MHRTACRGARVPYAQLFGYNGILSAVYAQPASRIAITMESPGAPARSFTYGQLQRDVIALADTLVLRMHTVGRESSSPGNAAVLTAQAPRAATHKSIFHVDAAWLSAAPENQYTHNALHDDGRYNAAVLCSPSYDYIVAMLALWALDLMAVPMAPQHHYDGEMTHVLEHSRAHLLLTQDVMLSTKLPSAYGKLTAASTMDMATPPDTSTPSTNTFQVKAVVNMTAWQDARQRIMEVAADDRPLELDAILPPVEVHKPLRSAQDIMQRMHEERAKRAAAEREEMEAALVNEFRSAQKKRGGSSIASEGDAPLTFDDANVHEGLNAVFQRRWAGDADWCPTPHDDCLMIYTSGTTAKPKGVVHTHASIGNQVDVLRRAWRWTAQDVIFSTLPLHHVHGIVNVLLTSLASGAHCILGHFDKTTAHRLDRGDITLFMGVPTMYANLVDAVGAFSPIEQTGWKKALSQNVRLMVSGSAALPVPILDRFRSLSGHTLLERYGMTEIGMALSQPYLPLDERVPGTVGQPLPSVSVYVKPTADEAVESSSSAATERRGALSPAGTGDLAVRSPSVFDRYWNDAKATAAELVVHPTTREHYFSTGDTVSVMVPERLAPAQTQRTGNEVDPKVLVPEHRHDAAVYAILGRSSVDIIKCRGYKLSALEIEAALLMDKHLVAEVAVFGVPDAALGEAIVAVVALASSDVRPTGGTDASAPSAADDAAAVEQQLRALAAKHLAHYKVPTRFCIVRAIPRNAMGKVNKKELRKQLCPAAA